MNNKVKTSRWCPLVTLAITLLSVASWSRPAAAAEDKEDKLGESVSAHVPAPAPAPAAKAAPHGGEEEDEDEPVQKSPDRHGEVLSVGVVVTSINKIDVQKESWEFDALLTMESNGKLRKCAKDSIQQLLPEGTLKKVDEADEWEEGAKKFRQCKITVEHQTDINVARYPFDVHDLEIVVGDEGDAIDGVVFKAIEDKAEIAIGEQVKLSGWKFGEITAHQKEITHPHGKGKLTQVVFELHASRPAFNSFVKGFLGVGFQLLIALVALVLTVKAAPNRIALVTGALIAVATAHNQVSTQVGVAYLTTADKFFFLSYFLLLTNVIFTASMIRAEDQKNDARVKSLYRGAWLVLPALTVVGSALVLAGVV